jgi:23S rRNA (adenine2030-N6)-methyltransferase
MNYRHLYHAGNFADVFKHILLISLIQSLQRKPKPFCYIETHAGRGCYDLTATEAQKNAEFREGASKIWKMRETPDVVTTYKTIIRQFNQKSGLHFYPGSPTLVKALLRANDRMWLCEWQEEEARQLQQLFIHERKIKVFQQNGYQALKAWLPPLERRGLVFMDPPFEQQTEFKDIINGLQEAYRRWQTGIYAIWYPIKSQAEVTRFHQSLRRTGFEKILIAELCIYPEDVAIRLNGCGLVIVNPPWQWDEQLQILLPWLWHQLTVKQQGYYRII